MGYLVNGEVGRGQGLPLLHEGHCPDDVPWGGGGAGMDVLA